MIFGVPMLLALATVQYATLSEEIVDNLIIVLSILISMFFAALSVLTSFRLKKDRDPGKSIKSSFAKRYNTSLKNTVATILFECILCIILLVASFAILFVDSFSNTRFFTAISITVYYLTFVVIINIFVVIKRLYILFEEKED